MNRAFTKEDSGDEDDLPDRPQPAGPNYVTPRGRRLLENELKALTAELAKFPLGSEDSEVRRRRRMVRPIQVVAAVDWRYTSRRA